MISYRTIIYQNDGIVKVESQDRICDLVGGKLVVVGMTCAYPDGRCHEDIDTPAEWARSVSCHVVNRSSAGSRATRPWMPRRGPIVLGQHARWTWVRTVRPRGALAP